MVITPGTVTTELVKCFGFSIVEPATGKELLRVEQDWIPSEPGTSLYIRPTIIATDPYLGVRASYTYRFFIILSPVEHEIIAIGRLEIQ